MRIGLVQTRAQPGNIPENITAHLAWASHAATQGAQLVAFPELSLSGYAMRTAHQVAMPLESPTLSVFQALSDQLGVVLAIGLPLRVAEGVQIGMAVFSPRKPRQAYAKQCLHSDEAPYFIAGDTQMFVSVAGVRVAPAICYESLQACHAAQACQSGLGLYLCAVAKPAEGVAKAYNHYPGIARQYQTVVAMANAVGPCEDFTGAGGTAVWDASGACVAQLGTQAEGLLVYDMATNRAQVADTPQITG